MGRGRGNGTFSSVRQRDHQIHHRSHPHSLLPRLSIAHRRKTMSAFQGVGPSNGIAFRNGIGPQKMVGDHMNGERFRTNHGPRLSGMAGSSWTYQVIPRMVYDPTNGKGPWNYRESHKWRDAPSCFLGMAWCPRNVRGSRNLEWQGCF